ILREAGCGLTVPPGDAGALAEALRRLKANPLELARYAANGRRYMQERLSRTAVLPRVSEAVIALRPRAQAALAAWRPDAVSSPFRPTRAAFSANVSTRSWASCAAGSTVTP